MKHIPFGQRFVPDEEMSPATKRILGIEMKPRRTEKELDQMIEMVREAHSPPKEGHSGDCTIYASMDNGQPTDGICTCGYGLRMTRKCEYHEMYSKEHPSYLPPYSAE